jgi:hypothetical protein
LRTFKKLCIICDTAPAPVKCYGCGAMIRSVEINQCCRSR